MIIDTIIDSLAWWYFNLPESIKQATISLLVEDPFQQGEANLLFGANYGIVF